MDPNVLAALAISLAPTIAIVFNTVLTWVVGQAAKLAAERVARQLASTTVKSDAKLDQLTSIAATTHTIVNSQRTEMIALIEKLRAEVQSLKRQAGDSNLTDIP